MHRDSNLSKKASIEGLQQRKLQHPFGDHSVTTLKNCVSLKNSVWIKFACRVEEFSQLPFVVELQSNAAVFESEFSSKTSDRIVNHSVLEVPQHRQNHFF